MAGKRPFLLVILDGWGHREGGGDNAIANGATPVWDRLWRGPHTLISGSGADVGLPAGQMGNSEVGHVSLGAGRVIYQNMSRIDNAIANGEFAKNPAYNAAIDKVAAKGGTGANAEGGIKNSAGNSTGVIKGDDTGGNVGGGAGANAADAAVGNGAVHIMGLLSPGGVHSHDRQVLAAARLAHQRGAKRVYLHAFLDGRDTPPRSAADSLAQAEALFAELFADAGRARVASVCGRYYAMDRDNRWERTEAAWKLLANADAEFRAPSASQALQDAYARDESDEFVQPTLIVPAGESPAAIQDGDCVLFMNFRADRARQLSQAFLNESFTGFKRKRIPALADFVMTTEYAAELKAPCAFPPEAPANTLPEYLAELGKTQLRIAETEKYAHVTFFFSGGREECYPGEERILVPSPKVATYDLKPEMSAPEVTDRLAAAIAAKRHDLIVCNYANGDMVGHTGNYEAAVQAVETLDACLGRVEQAVLDAGGEALITADHGNCERMMDHASGQRHTQHTTELVPLVYVGRRRVRFNGGGVLADVAPSLLALMGLPQPAEMTGRSLLAVE